MIVFTFPILLVIKRSRNRNMMVDRPCMEGAACSGLSCANLGSIGKKVRKDEEVASSIGQNRCVLQLCGAVVFASYRTINYPIRVDVVLHVKHAKNIFGMGIRPRGHEVLR